MFSNSEKYPFRPKVNICKNSCKVNMIVKINRATSRKHVRLGLLLHFLNVKYLFIPFWLDVVLMGCLVLGFLSVEVGSKFVELKVANANSSLEFVVVLLPRNGGIVVVSSASFGKTILVPFGISPMPCKNFLKFCWLTYFGSLPLQKMLPKNAE